MPKYVKTHIAEAFPVLYGHVSRGAQRCGEGPGPFYAAGSEHLDLYSDAVLAHANWGAERLRAAGYTVTVSVEAR